MYYIVSLILFYCYWAIVALIAALCLREVFSSRNWKTQATAALALIPLMLRVFFIK